MTPAVVGFILISVILALAHAIGQDMERKSIHRDIADYGCVAYEKAHVRKAQP